MRIEIITQKSYNIITETNKIAERQKDYEVKIMMNTIIYEGRKYNAETIKGYYKTEICVQIDADTEQEFFDKYIELDPTFVDLFKYDIDPIE